MYKSSNHRYTTVLFITLIVLSAFAVACSKDGQPASNSSASSPASPSSAAGDFEGLIAMKMEAENQTSAEMTYFLKGKQTRIETKIANIPEGSAVVLLDTEAGKVITLMPSRKMYITTDLKAAAEEMKEVKKAHGEDEAEFPKITPTGKQETIAGYNCEHWLMGENQEIDMCVAKGLGYFGMGGQSGGGLGSWKNMVFSPKMLAAAAAHPEWVKFLAGGAFPLKLSTTREGQALMTMEATRVEKRPLDDSLFVIPTDYKEFSMPALPKMPAPPARQ